MCEGNAWERQEYDTDASWLAFSEHYLPQQPPRSVNAAFRAYRGHAEGTNKTANSYFRAWARSENVDGVRYPDTLTWDERASAYDAYISAQRAAKREQAKLAIEDDEFIDYEHELAEWRRRYELLKLSPDGMGVFALAALFKLRKEIADLGRRAVGLPEKITRGELDVKSTVLTLAAEDVTDARRKAKAYEQALLDEANGSDRE